MTGMPGNVRSRVAASLRRSAFPPAIHKKRFMSWLSSTVARPRPGYARSCSSSHVANPAARQRLAHVISEVEVEDRVQAARVAGQPIRKACGLAEDKGVRLDRTQTAPQLNPEGRIDSGHMVAADAVGAVCGQPVLRGPHELLLHIAIAGVELWQRDHVGETAVVVRPLPESVVGGGVAILLDRIAKEVMAAPGVIGHEVEQHAYVAVVGGLHEADQRRIAAVARL